MAKRKAKLYSVETWDGESQAWTPQAGVPTGPFTRSEMITTIIPLLNELGYPCSIEGLDGIDPSESPCLSICEAGNERLPL